MSMGKKYHEMIQRCNCGLCWMVLEGFWPMHMERIAFEGKRFQSHNVLGSHFIIFLLLLPACRSTEFPDYTVRLGRVFFPRPDRYSQEYLHSCILPSWINLGLFRSSRPSEIVPFMDSKRLSMKKPHNRCRVMPPAFFSLPKISRHQDTWRLPKCLGRHVFNLCSLFPLCPSLSIITVDIYSKHFMYGFSHV